MERLYIDNVLYVLKVILFLYLLFIGDTWYSFIVVLDIFYLRRVDNIYGYLVD